MLSLLPKGYCRGCVGVDVGTHTYARTHLSSSLSYPSGNLPGGPGLRSGMQNCLVRSGPLVTCVSTG